MTGQGRGPDWRKDGAPAADFFDLKGVLEAVARHAARPLDLEPLDGADGRFHPTRSARWSGGVMGQIHPQWAAATGLPNVRLTMTAPPPLMAPPRGLEADSATEAVPEVATEAASPAAFPIAPEAVAVVEALEATV